MLHKINNKIVLYILLIIIFISTILLFYIYSGHISTMNFMHYRIDNNDHEYILNQNITIKEDVPTKYSKLYGFMIKIGSLNDIGKLHIALMENEKKVQEWNVDVQYLQDNSYKVFHLDKKLSMQKDKKYQLQLSCLQENQHCNVTIYVNNAYSSIYSNDKQSLFKSINCKILYDSHNIRYIFYLLYIVIASIIFFMIYFSVKEEIIMAIIVIIISSLYFIILPNGIEPDMVGHFLRAFEISHGNIYSQHIGPQGEGGNYLPDNLLRFREKTVELNNNHKVPYLFGTMSVYSPTNYIPQSLGILLAEYLTDNVYNIYLSGRLANFIFCFILCMLSIYIAPFGKKFFLMVILFPMSIHQMVSMSADASLNSLSILFFSYILYITCKKQKIEKFDIIILYIISIMLSLSKVVYIILLSLLIVIDNGKFKNIIHMFAIKLILPVVCIILNLFWIITASGYMNYTQDVNIVEQIKFIIGDFPAFIMILIHTIYSYHYFWISQMFGSQLGYLHIKISSIMPCLYIALIIFQIVGENITIKISEQCKRLFISLVPVIVCGFLGILTIGYLSWNPVKNQMIEGIQGRYFIPFAAPLLLLLLYFKNFFICCNSKKLSNYINIYFYILLLTIHGITLVDLVNFFQY